MVWKISISSRKLQLIAFKTYRMKIEMISIISIFALKTIRKENRKKKLMIEI